jgi:hypothetical protein
MNRNNYDILMAAWFSYLAAILYLKYSNEVISVELFTLLLGSLVMITKNIGELETGRKDNWTLYIRYAVSALFMVFLGTFVFYSFKNVF